MTRGAAWTVHAAALTAGLTGLYYGWMCYFCVREDEFAIVNHPWQPALRALHVLLVPLLVFAVGLLWRTHVWARIRSGHRDRRRTGVLLAALFAPMVVSGYLLQTAVDESLLLVWRWLHGVSSVLWIAIYAVHQWQSRSVADDAA